MKYVVTRKPYNRLSTLNEFDRIFNNFWNDFPVSTTARVQTSHPRVDIRELEDQYVLEAELPGFTEKDVDVNVDKHVLTISSVEKEVEKDAKAENVEEKHVQETFLVRERRSASFNRSFVLPEGVSEDKIKGEFKHGVLTLVIPKVPVKKPKKIEVKLAS